MRITRLKLENWKNFQSLDIYLRSRAIFIGPNASGKSNLLDAVRFLRDVAAPTFGGLDSAMTRRGGVRSVRCLAARQKPDIGVEVELGDDAGPQWSYALRVTNVSQRDSKPKVTRETVKRWRDGTQKTLLDRPEDDDRSDPERLSETHLEQVRANGEFREVAEFFRSVRYLHVVPQIVRTPAQASDIDESAYGARLLAQINETPARTREARLRKMNEALRIAVPQLDDLELRIESDGAPHLRARYKHWRPQGAWQTEEQFSDGTLRLLGLVWALMDKGGPLLLEEPELSLHTAVVSQISEVIRRATRRNGRQSLITTHSHELLSAPGIGLDEVFVLSPDENGTRIVQPAQMRDVEDMLNAGMSLPDAIMPYSRPSDAEQLPLFAKELY